MNGRPPDDLAKVGVLRTLERSTSPVDHVDLRESKKAKSDNPSNVLGDGVCDMEADVVFESVVLRSGPLVNESMDAECAGVKNKSLNTEDVVVLDEDCVITEEGDYPNIRFSERVHDQGCEASTMVPVALFEVEILSADQASFYGPWIVAKPHHRMYQNWDVKGRTTRNVTHDTGLCFMVLHEQYLEREADENVSKVVVDLNDVQHGVQILQKEVAWNIVYKQSNPGKCSKNGGGSIKDDNRLDIITLDSDFVSVPERHTFCIGRGSM
ncbi:hypothetical protein V6N11_010370 [Hibiscus sabdariffa]|uniref:Uncharacterized protein n=1 Tax=Hibiscus sabdariffa TaxID=183260 RepID=A0ABR2S5Y7_9ROSI